MREVEKEIRQRILETEDFIKMYHKAKNKELEKYYEGCKYGLQTALSLMLMFGKEENE